MRRQIAVALCAGMFGFVVPSALAIAQQKTAKTCLQEWRANKAAKEANGLTQKAYLAQCRAGGAPDRAGAAPAKAANPPGGSGNAGKDRPIYLSIKEIMESVVDPSADALWGAVGTVLDKEGTHEMLPKTQEEWFDVRRAAVRIIEGANLLMMPGREAAPPGTKSEAPGVELEPAEITVLIKKKRKSFDAFAKALQAVGAEAMRASDAQDTAALLDIGGRMQDVCENCHQVFWYPGAKQPGTGRIVQPAKK